jgi:NADH:ubiquinone oxidoreductase subunit 2 (subunit N)
MENIHHLLPEIIIISTIIYLILSSIITNGTLSKITPIASILGLSIALLYCIVLNLPFEKHVFLNIIIIDPLSFFFRVLFILLGILQLALSFISRRILKEQKTEYYLLILSLIVCLNLFVSSIDLLFSFLCLSCFSLISSCLIAFGIKKNYVIEVALKHFITTSFSQILFVLASSFLFMQTKTLVLAELSLVELSTFPSFLLFVIFLLFVLIIAIQMHAFPMVMLMPDIVQGTVTPLISFFSFATIASGIGFAMRFIITILFRTQLTSPFEFLKENTSFNWLLITTFITGTSMLYGSILAFLQKNVNRSIGYLMVMQSGFYVLGLLVVDTIGLAAILYQLIVDLFAISGIFYTIYFFTDIIQSDYLSDWRGLLKQNPAESICLIFFLLCFIGIPPFPGFLGKFSLIGAAIAKKQIVLAYIAIMVLFLSTATIFKIALYFIKPQELQSNSHFGTPLQRTLYLGLFVTPIILILFNSDTIFTFTKALLENSINK